MPDENRPSILPPDAKGIIVIRSDDEAIAIAHEIAAVLQPGAAQRDRKRQRAAGDYRYLPNKRSQVSPFRGNGRSRGIRRHAGRDSDYFRRRPVAGANSPGTITSSSGGYPSAGQRRAAGIFFARRCRKVIAFANALSETGGQDGTDIRTRLEASERGLSITGRKGYRTGSLYAHWIAFCADTENNAQLAFCAARIGWADGHRRLGLHFGQRNPPPAERFRRENLVVEPFNLFPTLEILRHDANPFAPGRLPSSPPPLSTDCPRGA